MRLALLVAFLAPLYGADYYIAQSAAGAGDGTSCVNARAISWNWSSATDGDTVHLCGTLTSQLSIPKGGTSTAITLKFETGAKFSAAYWSVTGAIDLNGKSRIVIDGGTNGIIEATANGDGLANQQIASGIYAQGSANWEVKNLTIRNIYVHTRNSSSDLAGSPETYGILTDGTSSESIHNNTIYQVKYGIFRSASSSGANNQWYSNTISKTNWGMGVTAAGAGVTCDNLKVYGNTVEIGNEWDDTTNSNHHNGIYAFTDVPETGKITNLQVYNNYFYGAVGQTWTSTAMIFTEYGVPSPKIFNNLFVGNSGDPANAYINLITQSGSSSPLIANNTIVGSSNVTYTNSLGTITPRCFELDANTSTTATVKNNICSTVEQAFLMTSGSSVTSDYNEIYNVTYYGVVSGTYYSSWANWQSSGRDANGRNTNPTLSGTYTPQAGSPAIGGAADLTGLSITALNSDKAGVARPSGAAWDIGAYQYGSTPSIPTAIVSGVSFTGVTFQ